MRVLIGIVAALAIIVVGFFAVGPDRVWQRVAGDPDMGRQTLETLTRTGKPNDALIAPQNALALAPDAEAPVYAVPPEQLFQMLLARVDETENINWVERDPEALYARGITTSPLLRFPDTNHIWVLPVGEDNATLVLYTAAQLGQSDMGKNRERLDVWIGLLSDVPTIN